MQGKWATVAGTLVWGVLLKDSVNRGKPWNVGC